MCGLVGCVRKTMITAKLIEGPYPRGNTIVVSTLPKEGETILVRWDNHIGPNYPNKMVVISIGKRWERDYIYLRGFYSKSWVIEGVLEVKP